MTPLERYRHDLDHGDFAADPAQLAVAEHLQRVYEALIATPEPRDGGLFGRLKDLLREKPHAPATGLYIWGGVGRGVGRGGGMWKGGGERGERRGGRG